MLRLSFRYVLANRLLFILTYKLLLYVLINSFVLKRRKVGFQHEKLYLPHDMLSYGVVRQRTFLSYFSKPELYWLRLHIR